jgi:hypothetical protein
VNAEALELLPDRPPAREGVGNGEGGREPPRVEVVGQRGFVDLPRQALRLVPELANAPRPGEPEDDVL